MAFDSDTRNLLARIVGECRQILAQEVEAQLQSRYGLYPDGRVLAIAQTADEQQAAQELKELLDHLAANEPAQGKKKVENAYSRLVREIGFTLLNRLAALRLGEERGIVVECVGQGMSSAGFQLYDRIANGALGNRYETYRAFLEGLFDELAIDLGVLFDRDTPHAYVFPSEAALSEVLERLNDAGLEERDVWRQDETIGWIYQYYNDPDERRAMRKASSAPRNSRELAVRNQFFTPRYVVEFLTDNTLGRLWYEMRRGETRLVEQCRYLVCRPNEVFLSDEYLDGWSEPIRKGITQVVTGNFDDLPRDVHWDEFQCLALMIDGYEVAERLWGDQWEERARAFFDRYEEEGNWQGNSLELWLSLFFLQRSWRSPSGPPDDETLKLLADLYAAWRQAMLSERAGEDDHEPADRPVYIPVRRPKDPRDIKILDPAGGSGHFSLYAFDLLLTIYEEGWERSNPDKASSLRSSYPTLEEMHRALPALILRHNVHSIDIDPRATQIASLALWLRAQRYYQSIGLSPKERPPITRSNFVTAEPMPGDANLLNEFLETVTENTLAELVAFVFERMELAGVAGSLLNIEKELTTEIDRVQKIRDPFGTKGEEYWLEVKGQVLAALEEYAGTVANGQATRRLLFAEDTTEGLAFIDLCHNHYDAIVMNPPFGASARLASRYLAHAYPKSSTDLAYAFIERTIQLLQRDGMIGCLSTRLGFFVSTFEQWRTDTLKGGVSLSVCADLGYGVLEALVETAAYVVSPRKHDPHAIFFDLLQTPNKESQLGKLLTDNQYAVVNAWQFSSLPGTPFSYWAPPTLLKAYAMSLRFDGSVGAVKRGVATGDNERFLRLAWEVDPSDLGRGRRWLLCAKGIEYSPYFIESKMALEWEAEGYKLKNFTDSHGRLRSRPQNVEFFYHPGLAYSSRTTSGFAPRVMPADFGFDQSSNPIFVNQKYPLAGVLASLLSRPVLAFVELAVGAGDTSQSGTAARNYTNGLIGRIPISRKLLERFAVLEEKGMALINNTRERARYDELSLHFLVPRSVWARQSTMRTSIQAFVHSDLERILRILDDSYLVDEECFAAYELDSESREFLDTFVGPHPMSYPAEGSANKERTAVRTKTKKCYWADRDLEVVSHSLQQNPREVIKSGDFVNQRIEDSIFTEGHLLISYCLGTALGRWDIRCATEGRLAPEKDFDPFSPLPSCPQGMLTNSQGLPAAQPPPDYPVAVSWDGILVDDPGFSRHRPHPKDITESVKNVIAILWEDSETIVAEICAVLGVRDLRDYFRLTSAGFFNAHLQHFSESRRRAPIYWPLSTSSGGYTVWIYYHRLTEETLYTAVNNYVEPKIQQLERHLAGLEGDLTQTFGREATAVRDEIDGLRAFRAELREFRDELLRVAGLPYKPNLNDGVIINAAPLHKLFPHRGWQQDTEKVWRALEAGEYDWSHMAYNIWPDRVREACRRDKSIAIAHGLEVLYEEESQRSPGKRRVAGNQMALDLDEDE